MKQREIAAKERDAGREQQVREIVTACEKVCARSDPFQLELWSVDR